MKVRIAFAAAAFAMLGISHAELREPSRPFLPEPMGTLDAWSAVPLMGLGINIGNTLENTAKWETGWGNPPVTRDFVARLASLGFRTVRVPVAWDTFAQNGRISAEKFARVGEIVDWITEAGMFCVINIHWDGGWIDSSRKERSPDTFQTFSPEAERKFQSYWSQIATRFAHKGEKLIFEGLNEETNFAGVGSAEQAYATLTRVNQLFVDTVRGTGGNNSTRLLIVAGSATDIEKTTSRLYALPIDTVSHRLFVSVHYYTPWFFAGVARGEPFSRSDWGSQEEIAEFDRLFDAMQKFCTRMDVPAFVGEFTVSETKETVARVRWMTAVAEAARSRKMVPVLWDTGNDVSRRSPYSPSPSLRRVLDALGVESKPAVAH